MVLWKKKKKKKKNGGKKKIEIEANSQKTTKTSIEKKNAKGIYRERENPFLLIFFPIYIKKKINLLTRKKKLLKKFNIRLFLYNWKKWFFLFFFYLFKNFFFY